MSIHSYTEILTIDKIHANFPHVDKIIEEKITKIFGNLNMIGICDMNDVNGRQ